jgi:hypothetical protein
VMGSCFCAPANTERGAGEGELISKLLFISGSSQSRGK